jgi:hypothetical protein
VLLIGSVTPGTLVGKDTVRTVLILQRARKQDSGNYTCAGTYGPVLSSFSV